MSAPLTIGVEIRERQLASRFLKFAKANGRKNANAARVLIDAGLRVYEKAGAAPILPMDDADAARAFAMLPNERIARGKGGR